jgi:hypothetical protein
MSLKQIKRSEPPIISGELPSLFGIHQSNRNFSDPYYWGKNQFNSAFPVALACYMRARKIPMVYVTYKNKLATRVGEIDGADVFGSNKPNADLYFAFESRFEGFMDHVHDHLPAIDLVICDGDPKKQIRPLEIKLTTLPDNSTEALDESQYGTELVIRSATTRYMALSMALAVNRKLKRVREIFEPSLAKVRDWNSKAEMLQVAPQAIKALECFLDEFKSLQRPMLMQPIWKTIVNHPF